MNLRCFPGLSVGPMSAETVFVDHKFDGYIYGYGRLEASEVDSRKQLVEANPTEYFTLQSTIQTAEMLIEARSVKEIAAIRTAATAKELPESGGLKGIAGYSDKLRIAEKHKPYTAPFLFKRRQLPKSLPSIRIGGQKLSQTL